MTVAFGTKDATSQIDWPSAWELRHLRCWPFLWLWPTIPHGDVLGLNYKLKRHAGESKSCHNTIPSDFLAVSTVLSCCTGREQVEPGDSLWNTPIWNRYLWILEVNLYMWNHTMMICLVNIWFTDGLAFLNDHSKCLASKTWPGAQVQAIWWAPTDLNLPTWQPRRRSRSDSSCDGWLVGRCSHPKKEW